MKFLSDVSVVNAGTVTAGSLIAVNSVVLSGTHNYNINWSGPAAARTINVVDPLATSQLMLGVITAPSTGDVLSYDGSKWINSASTATLAIGSAVGSGTAGSVLFVDSSGELNQDNNHLFWDDTNNRLGVGTSSPGSTLDVDGGITLKRVSTATNYTVLATDYLVGVSDTSSPRTITLPAASSVADGQIFVISDESGNASTNNITIVRNATPGTDTINGASSYVLNKSNMAVSLYSNGTNAWHITVNPDGAQGPQGMVGNSATYRTSFTSSDITSGNLTVTHGLGQQYVSVSIYDNSNRLVIPNQVTLTSSSACTVDLNGYTVTGTWSVIVLAAGGVGTQGTTGSQGTQGLTGSQGNQGLTGPQGTQGLTGSQGNQGLTGPQGTQGLTGSGTQGATGTQGNQGLTGSTGTQGNQGYQGFQGNQGLTGSTGTQGNQGYQGFQGNQGLTGSGTQGATGTQGSTGSQGNQGNQGLTGSGTQGATGTQGSTGSQGNQGNQGLTGSGTQGNQGTTGSNGTQGATGTQGNQGLTGSTGTQGDQGYQGFQGTAGSGSVTSVGLSMPSGFTLSAGTSPVTTSGTLTVTTALSGLIKGTGSGFTSATANSDYATPTYVDNKFTSGSFKSDGTNPILKLNNSSGVNCTVFDKNGLGLTDKMTFLLGVGQDLVTGTNLTTIKNIACFNGKILSCKVLAGTNGSSGGFTFDIKQNGTSIFTSAPSVAASTTTVQTFTNISSIMSVAINDLFTIDVTSVGTGVQNVNVTLVLSVKNQ